MSVVYFIQAGKDGPIKVGTARDLGKRIRQLSSGCPDPLIVLATIPGGLALERRIHRALRPHQRRSEWFNPTREMNALALIANRFGIDAVLRWLERAEATVIIPPLDYEPTGDRGEDARWLVSFAIKTAIARHGIEAVCEAMGRGDDRVLAIASKQGSCTIESFIGLALLDPGACAPFFAYSGDVPGWIADRADRDSIDGLLSRLGPRGARA